MTSWEESLRIVDESEWGRLMYDTIAKSKGEGHRRPQRIVSYTVYRQAKLAESEGATPRQIEMCLAGAMWSWVKDNYP